MNILKISIITILIIIFTVILTAASHALIQYTATKIYDGEIHDLFEYHLNDDISFPDELTSKNELYVFIIAGGAYQNIKIFGLTGASELAYELEKALSSSYLKNAVIMYREEKYSSVLVEYSMEKFGIHEHSNTVKVGEIRRCLMAAGYKPHIVVKVHNFAELSTKIEPTYSWAGEKWFNPEESPFGDDLQISVTSSHESIFIFYMIFLLLPVLSVIGTAITAIWAVNSAASVEYRLQIIDSVPFKLSVTTIIIQLPLFVFLTIFTDWLRKIADLWFGSFQINPMFQLLILFAMSVLLVIPISMWTKKKITENDHSASDLEMMSRENFDKSMLIKSILLLQGVAIVVLIYALFCYNYIGMALALLVLLVLKNAVKKKKGEQK